MVRRIALVGAVERDGLEKHIALLDREGPHWDGWTFKNVARAATQLLEQLGGRARAHFRVFLYDSAQPVDRKIQWIAEVDALRLFRPPEHFVDPAHGDEYAAHAQFRYRKIELVLPGMGLDQLVRPDGARLTSRDGRELLNGLIIVRDGLWAPPDS